MTIDVSKFSILSVQVVLFTPNSPDYRFRTSDVLAFVVPTFASRYDGEIESTPGDKNRPPIPIGPGVTEIGLRFVTPAVTLSSEDGKWSFRATTGRTDSIWSFKNDESDRVDLKVICAECLGPLMEYPIRRQLQIGRMALVVRRSARIESPAHVLASQFCRQDIVRNDNPAAPLRNSCGFRIDNLKRYVSPIDSKQVNSWVRCHSDQVSDAETIVVEQDLNTLNEDESSTAFSVDQIQRFCAWAPMELDKIMQLYFPT